jgi:hypothetical protein
VPAGAKVAPLGDSDRVRVGEQVAVVGAPYGLSYSLSVGWISAKWPPNTVYKSLPLAEFFQTTASINTGNSGGPMFNMAGEVIGVVSHIISKSRRQRGAGIRGDHEDGARDPHRAKVGVGRPRGHAAHRRAGRDLQRARDRGLSGRDGGQGLARLARRGAGR